MKMTRNGKPVRGGYSWGCQEVGGRPIRAATEAHAARQFAHRYATSYGLRKREVTPTGKPGEYTFRYEVYEGRTKVGDYTIILHVRRMQ